MVSRSAVVRARLVRRTLGFAVFLLASFPAASAAQFDLIGTDVLNQGEGSGLALEYNSTNRPSLSYYSSGGIYLRHF